MVDPATIAVLAQLATTAAGAASNSFTKDKAGKPPKFQRKLIDQVLQGLQGTGPFADLFSGGEDAFKKSISDPLLQKFRTQTAPNIQQSFIASGQQRGSPLDVALARGGLDVQGQIDQLFLPFQQQKDAAKQNAINSILGFGVPGGTTGITPLGGAAAGFQSAGGFNTLFDFLNTFGKQGTPSSATASQGFQGGARKGFS